jgi:hypothetical protein
MSNKFKVSVPVQDDMGSIAPFIVRDTPMTSKAADALWHLNKMRERDGLSPLNRMPNGTKYEKDLGLAVLFFSSKAPAPL